MFGIATFPSIEVVSLAGIVFSFFGFVSSRFCILPIFTILWTLYYSLVDITGIFHQQCDDLLLEAGVVGGFLCYTVAVPNHFLFLGLHSPFARILLETLRSE